MLQKIRYDERFGIIKDMSSYSKFLGERVSTSSINFLDLRQSLGNPIHGNGCRIKTISANRD
jgi:hypothetical protein